MTSSLLLEPLAFRNGARAKNRIWLAPMTNQQSHDDGSLSDDELHWLEVRAKGGFGVIESCASHVAKDGQGWPGELGIFDDAQVPGLTRLATSLRAAGAIGLMQIFHGGLRAPSSLIGERPWSASEYTEDKPNFETPRAATEEDIVRVIDQFRASAVRAHRAGFEGVELHGAHGYLLGQFLSATINRRSDRWGGSFENRARLIREATRAVRGAVPASFVVGVRLSPEDWGNAKGLDLDESLELASWLTEDGVDFLHVSMWNAAKNTTKRPAEHAIPLFRRAVPREVPIVVAGSIWTRADAEALLEKGADAVALGRSAITNPRWPLEFMEPGWEPRRPPITIAELKERGLSEKFVGYMRNWKNFVAD